MTSRICFSKVLPFAGLAALMAAGAACAQSAAEARVVRLSFVEGTVTVQRPDVQDWAEAPVNTPLQEGFKLCTGENSYAEIQFENGGTIRLGQLSLLELNELGQVANGGTSNHVYLRQGYATFHLIPSDRADSLQVETVNGTLTAHSGTRLRVDLDQDVERVEVFDGTVKADGNLGHIAIEKDYALLMQPGATEPTVVSKGITEDDWDHWVDDRDSSANVSSTVPPPESYDGDASESPYGWTDLQENGTWANVAGLGYGWSPSTVSADWAPYTLGEWCWYPGYGYTWIGAERWGWLPYHYGSWKFLSGRGWVWFLGNFRTWSPALVSWHSGPGWIGWTVRAQRREDTDACGANCGGGIVSSTTFRQGGMLTASAMLRVSPASGERVNEPGVAPLASARLPGRIVSAPALVRQQGNTMTGNSAVVYDTQQNRYLNGNDAAEPQQARSYSGTRTQQELSSNPASVQPTPVTGREAGNQPAINPNPCASPSPSLDCVIVTRRPFTSPVKPSPTSHPTGEPAGGHPPASPSPGSGVGGRAGGSPSSGGHH